MGTGTLGKATNWHEDDLGAATLAERNSIWGEIDGEIVSFDPATQTATIQPLYEPLQNGKPVKMPELLEIPVRFARGGNGALTYPVDAGDKVVLRPRMRSSENYHTEGKGDPSDQRSFNLSDMEAHLDGGESLQDPIKNFDNKNVHLRLDPEGKYGFKGNAKGQFAIHGNAGNWYEIVTQLVELLASDTLTIKHGSSSGSGHALEHQAQYAELAAKLRAMVLPE